MPWRIIGIGIAIFIMAATANFFHWSNFMDQCSADHKRYECEIMYQRAYGTLTVLVAK